MRLALVVLIIATLPVASAEIPYFDEEDGSSPGETRGLNDQIHTLVQRFVQDQGVTEDEVAAMADSIERAVVEIGLVHPVEALVEETTGCEGVSQEVCRQLGCLLDFEPYNTQLFAFNPFRAEVGMSVVGLGPHNGHVVLGSWSLAPACR